MRLLPRSAANRIAVIAFLAYAGAMLALGAAVFIATHTAFSRQIDTTIEQTTNSLSGEYRDDGIRGLTEALNQLQGPGPVSLGTALFGPDSQRIAGNLKTSMPAEGWQQIVFLDPLEGPDPARAKVTMLPGGYRMVVAADLESLEAIDRTILGIFAAAFASLLLLGLAGAVALAAYLRRRLAGIETTAAAIVAGDLRRRATVGSAGDEFDRVAASLNAMLDRIAGLIANLRQVTGDLAHDLRTPLSRLRNQLERLSGTTRETEREHLVESAVAQADNVLVLFDAILRISEVEEGSLKRAFGPVSLSDLVTELGETLVPLAEDAGQTLDVVCEPNLTVQGDRELLAQAIINLVENALRHTPPGAAIQLISHAEADGVAVIVQDNGDGIPEKDRMRVQERFVRLEAARATPGHGLGLSLVHAIAEAHGASLTLSDAHPGLLVEIYFPQRTST